jgi:hypothetical protein
LLNFNFEQLNLLFQVLQIKTIRYSSLNLPHIKALNGKNRNTNSTQDISFKERLSALKNLPNFFKLVWRSSPSKTLISFH